MFKIRWGEIVRGEPLVALPHQTEFLEKFKECRGVIGCFDEPGLGKSLEIMMAIESSLIEGEKALIVMPPNLKQNWIQEIKEFTYFEIGKDIDLVPYTMLGKTIDSFKDYKFVADDEGHLIKNPDTQRTMKFISFLEENTPEFFIHATGTPIGNRLPDIFTFLYMIAQYDHVSPRITVRYPTYYEFCERFCYKSPSNYGSGYKYTGSKNVSELREYLKPWTIRRKTDEVLTLPPMENVRVFVSYKEDKELAKVWEQFQSTGEFGGIDITAKKESAIATAPFTTSWVANELEQGAGPVVVFSDHREPAITINEGLQKAGYKSALIIGGQSMDIRNKIRLDFQSGKLDAVVMTAETGAMGITLTKSNLIVGNDLPWKPDTLDQIRRRIRRISQTRPQRCVYMVGSRACDLITQLLISKLEVINQVIEKEK